MSKLLIIGAGGHGKVVADVVSKIEQWDHISFLEDKEEIKETLGFPVIGKLKDYKLLKNEFRNAFVAIGNNSLRLVWLEKLYKEGFILPIIIHPFSAVSRFSNIKAGTIIMAGAVVNAGTSIGKGCILNTCSSIDHDCTLGDGVHVSPGARIGGTVSIGSCTWICIGSSISNNITIGSRSTIAAGAAVVHDVPDNVIAAGVPAIIKETRVNKK